MTSLAKSCKAIGRGFFEWIVREGVWHSSWMFAWWKGRFRLLSIVFFSITSGSVNCFSLFCFLFYGRHIFFDFRLFLSFIFIWKTFLFWFSLVLFFIPLMKDISFLVLTCFVLHTLYKRHFPTIHHSLCPSSTNTPDKPPAVTEFPPIPNTKNLLKQRVLGGFNPGNVMVNSLMGLQNLLIRSMHLYEFQSVNAVLLNGLCSPWFQFVGLLIQIVPNLPSVFLGVRKQL